MPEDGKKKKSRLENAAIVVVVLLLCSALLYLGVQLFSILRRTYKTETAIAYTMADSVALDGIAVFEAVDVPGEGDLGYLVQDGERVTGGTMLAEQYTNSDQGVLREHLDRMDRAISLLTKSQNSNGSDLTVLTTQTKNALYNLLDQLDSAAYSSLTDAEDSFLLAQNRMQVSTGQASSFEDTLAALQAERQGVADQLGQLATITADTNGYFVSSTAELPFALDTADLDAKTPTEMQAMLDGGVTQDAAGLAGRIVTGFSWRFYAVCPLATAERLTVGAKVGISVPGKQNDALTATVFAITPDEEADLAKVVLECQSINANVLRFGQETVQLDIKTYTGIRIDKSALHIVEGEKGVYVRYGNLQRFCKITILYENEYYILVPADGALRTDNEVRLYDEIIVEGTDLGEGKLI